VRARVCRSHRGIARRWAAMVAISAAMLQPANACAQAPPVRTVAFVDLNRYAGDWFEIARFPNRFQRKCVGEVRASYARRADGRIDVVNRCRTANGQTEARGDPGREYLWILARTPRLDTESMEAARTAAKVNGFDVGRLVQTTQEGRRP
jgi:apolipoprotein D and lipocalin family protein